MKCKKCEEYYIYNDYKFCSICYKQMNGYDYVSIDNIKDCLIKKYINKNKFNLLLKILLGNISKKITLLEVSNLVDDTFLMSNECNIIYGLLKDKITNEYSNLILKVDSNSFIPKNEENTDYHTSFEPIVLESMQVLIFKKL